MTETPTVDSVREAIAVIDANLGVFGSRDLVAASEVSDLLLDIRLLLAASAEKQPLEA